MRVSADKHIHTDICIELMHRFARFTLSHLFACLAERVEESHIRSINMSAYQSYANVKKLRVSRLKLIRRRSLHSFIRFNYLFGRSVKYNSLLYKSINCR